MGVVYAAHDERLDRAVAIKAVRREAFDDQARRRFWREAQTAAAVNHPNICQVHEIGEADGELFIVMELLEGESLAQTIERGPLAVADSVQVMLAVLSALEALHHRGIVHRDLKPANVFRTAHGIKLLDFGVARPADPDIAAAETATRLTSPGTLVGTPHYMAPEQLQGRPSGAATDIFAAGAILFEMLAGRRAFAGRTLAEIYHAISFEQPPALAGSPLIVAVDGVLHRALAKKPEGRHRDAAEMAHALRAALAFGDTNAAVQARAMTRLIALPFRILRADAETDFLSFSLPDAITSSLSALESLVVRSSLLASRFAKEPVDLKAVAEQAEVDVILTGSLLRAGDRLRVNAQLLEAPSGTLVWTHSSELAVHDVFQVQDEIIGRVIGSLPFSLSAREERMLRHDVPSNAAAYEFYLRANQLGTRRDRIALARDLYLECVGQDAGYAPAWARLAHCHRVMGKWGEETEANLAQAEAAFQRALSLNPDLPLAHNLYTHLEAERGRAEEAMVRLLGRAAARPNDPELFAGLVYVCRYCGLLEVSASAHDRARRLDPNVHTTVMHTYLWMGEYQLAIDNSTDDVLYVDALALACLGREEEAAALLRSVEERDVLPLLRAVVVSVRALMEGKRAESLEALQQMSERVSDPEALFYVGRQLAYAGERLSALRALERAVQDGFFCYPAFMGDPWLDSLRSDPEFNAIVGIARERHTHAREAFLRAGGKALLGSFGLAAGP
jgi:non-specific serine/threonine protein kinase